MTKYDWPVSPRGGDDPAGRAGHVAHFRPRMDPAAIVDAPPPVRRGRGRLRGVPHNAPVGNQNLWFPIGPSVMTNGQATGTPNVAGRIRDLQVEPTSGDRVYAASATGGVWFSADRGASWRPLDEWRESPDRTDIGKVANSLACGAVHVIWGAAVNGSQDEVWVGTGELYGGASEAPGGQVAGIGLLTATGPAAAGAWSVVLGESAAANFATLRGRAVFRIVGDPGNPQQLFAATTNGFYFRPPGGAWARFAPWPVATLPIDVVLTRPAANRVRIWVAERSALWVTEFTGPAATPINPAGLAFTAVPLPDVHSDPPAVWPKPKSTRLALAASADGTRLYVLGRRLKDTAAQANPSAQLWSVDATTAVTAAGLAAAATKLTGTPPELFGVGHDQSDYDMCITTHPTVAGRVYIGGSYAATAGGFNAAIYRCETTATDVNPTLIGDGVHADVHVLRIGPPGPVALTGRTVWVGCDGGLFRSDDDGDPGTFSEQNEGLAVLEPGYVASHPTNAGIVAAGFQDNGTAVRTGDSVWRQSFGGDGGGTVYDPNATNRYFRQYIKAKWQSSDGSGSPPVLRGAVRLEPGSTLKTSETVENEAALFYSGADAVLHGGYTHLAVGTDRVWYSRDWGGSWVTLPTATDPRSGNVNLAQDQLNPVPGTVTADFSDTTGSTDCCSSTHTGTIGVRTGVLAVKFAVPADAGGNSRLRILVLYAGGLVWLDGTRPAAATGAYTWTRSSAQAFREPTAGAETTAFGNGDPVTFLHAVDHVSDVAVHDPDRGPLGSCYVSTIGDPDFAAGTPTRQDTLWFFDGVDTWWPTGLRTTNAARGSWPNIPGSAPPRTSQVTAPALGVVVDPADRNKVYVATSVGVVRGTLTIAGGGTPTYSWAWEQFMNGLPEAAVQDLSIHRFDNVRLLRAALQARGVWEVDLANVVSAPTTYLRLYHSDARRRLPTPLTGRTVDGEPQPPRWDASPDIVIDTTSPPLSSPGEADLSKLRTSDNPGTVASVSINDRHPVVHVLVHHRWSHPEPKADVRVLLMRKDMPANGVVPLGALWPALVTAAAGAAAPPGILPDNWTQAGAILWKKPDADVETRMPRSVSFDLDLSAEPSGSTFVLLAVVMSASNQITAADLLLSPGTNATTVDQLVTASPHVAARSVHLQ